MSRNYQMSDTLILDSSYQVIGSIPWRRAVGKWVAGKVEIIVAYTDRFIKTASGQVPMPAVVRYVGKVIKKYYNRMVRFNKRNIMKRDQNKCCYCGVTLTRKSHEFEHIVPKSKGGKTDWKNIVSSCRSCNRLKGDKPLHLSGLELRRKPYVPKWLPESEEAKLRRQGYPEDWKPFLE